MVGRYPKLEDKVERFMCQCCTLDIRYDVFVYTILISTYKPWRQYIAFFKIYETITHNKTNKNI